ncbi:ribonuclease H-like domain-containing protein, partial [Chroococcidiopsidales cyanobacterium LEGE 13417]|nr:ribonuclease H-like domain-containing protein [Chroococcidiopsidales cyanobacterium LEGE 13417]
MKQYNHRNLVNRSKGKIVVNENELDIFYTDCSPRDRWEPDRELMPYNQLRQIVIDIETSGLSSQTERIYAIGCMDENWQATIFMELDESSLLQKFIRHVSGYCADVILSFNGTQFDLPFIIARCEKYNIRHPFKISDKLRTIQTAQVFGQPLKIHQVYVKGSQHVDVYICVLRWDYVAKCLNNARSLKRAVLEMGLRQQQRLVLSYQQILECWQQGAESQGWAKIRKYLIYDLDDTKSIADKLVPSYYYGLVISVPGLHRNVAKIDVASLYPSIMLKYGICSGKDPRRVGLSILEYLTQERLRLKQRAKAGDIDASHAQSALKVTINSLFGFLGTSGLSFNDMEAAALVTAYGRRILRFAIEFIEMQGGIQVESDTDGIFFSHPQPVQVYETLKAAMPEGIDIELETQATAMFVPSRGAKNYILWHDDGSVTAK